MSVSDSFGEGFGRRLNARATGVTRCAIRKSMIAATELRYDDPQFALSTPPAEEDAFMVGVYLRHCPRYEYWEEGKAAPVSVLRPGETIIYDLKRKPTFHLNHAFHTVHFYLPRPALDAIADEAEAPRFEDLAYRPAVSREDPTIFAMAAALLPFFRDPESVSRLFADHLMLALGHHVATTYGGMAAMRPTTVGGLTPRQLGRVRDLVEADPARDIALSDLAAVCGLSASHFARAFRRTVGASPHQWVIERRIARAKILLRESPLGLAEIAERCGFSDQSHLTRQFTAKVGAAPGQWRRILSS